VPAVSQNLQEAYAGARARVARGAPVTYVQIGSESTFLLAGKDEAPALVVELSLGSEKTARQFFARALPTGAELEQAIAWVEDELMRADSRIRGSGPVFAGIEALREILRDAGAAAAPPASLDIDTVERAFNRLAAVAQGRPSAREGLPSGASFAATLLILRELMHHLQFARIVVLG
jgi:exopolyphosphatase/pppGpp-phosphohydrolase